MRTGLGPCGFKLAVSVEGARRTPYHQPPPWLPNWPLPVLLLLLDRLTVALLLLLVPVLPEMMSAAAAVAP